MNINLGLNCEANKNSHILEGKEEEEVKKSTVKNPKEAKNILGLLAEGGHCAQISEHPKAPINVVELVQIRPLMWSNGVEESTAQFHSFFH